jgi:hypothetical protein
MDGDVDDQLFFHFVEQRGWGLEMELVHHFCFFVASVEPDLVALK